MAESSVRSFALTGGIATGKSTYGRILRELLPSVVIFDCDQSVQLLLAEGEILGEISQKLGADLVVEGELQRAALRELVFADSAKREELEGILHPRVREECLELKAKTAREGTSPLFVADVPLLFENSFDFGYERSLLVATSRATQLDRLKSRSGFDDTLAESILSAQLPLEEKIKRADVVFWNEGAPSVLRLQIGRFLNSLNLMSDPKDSPKTPEAEATEVEDTIAVVTESAEEAQAANQGEVSEEPDPSFDVPETIDVNEFRERPLGELLDLADGLPLRMSASAGKSALVFDLLSFYATHGTVLEATGVLEQAKENYAMLRDPKRSFRTAPDDFYVGGNLLKEHGVKVGQLVRVRLRAPRERDKYLSALEILTIEGAPAEEFSVAKSFDQLTSLFPEERFVLERAGEDALAVRLIDIVAPVGKGQRGLIVAPPRGGKTILLKEIAKSIATNHPETKLIVLLLDERPEEVTDFEETVDVEVFASTFDEPSKRHAQVSDLVLERARRLVEQGKDVVILLDSLTRLARGYNNSQTRGGPIGSGGLSPHALQKSRKFFGAARNVEEGGSLTIVATCLIETENRMDDIIFEELKGTGNMEIRLDRELAESRIYPAVHIPQSGTRNDDRLYHPQEMEKVIEIRRALSVIPIGEALETLLKQLSRNSTNAELLMRGMI